MHLGALSHALEDVLSGVGYLINTEFGGHGIGSAMHQDPHVPNAGRTALGYMCCAPACCSRSNRG